METKSSQICLSPADKRQLRSLKKKFTLHK